MASSPSSSLHPLTNPNPSPNPESMVTFASPPLPKPTCHQELHSERAKRHRQRALRMSRENQIPALALHCVSQLSTNPCCKENPHSLLKGEASHCNEDGEFRQLPQDFTFQEAFLSSQNTSPGGGLVIYDGRLLKNRTLENMHTFSDCSGRDGDVSDAGSNRGLDLFELHNWRNASSSSPSSSDEGPLNVTRAVSECSSIEHTQIEFGILNDGGSMKVDDNGSSKEGCGMKDDLSTEYWKLQADVLAAECNLLRVEKDLALRRWNRGYGRSDATKLKEGRKKYDTLENVSCSSRHTRLNYCEDQTKEASQVAFDKIHDISHATSCFAHEALRNLDEMTNRSSQIRVPFEDPTEALQERLQNLLLTAQNSILEQRSHRHSFPDLRSHDVWDKVDMLGVSARTIEKRTTRESMLDNRYFAEMYTSKKQQGFTSVELSETKAAAAFIRREYRSMLSDGSGLLSGSNADQMLGEETYCKEAIRQIVKQVQAESEQWSQVQEILLNLQEEMGALIESRELWEERAHQAEAELSSLKEMVHDWRCRAQSAEEEMAILQYEKQSLKTKIHNMKQKYAQERRGWKEMGCGPSESIPLPIPDGQLSIGVSVPRPNNQLFMGAACDIEDQPRHANVGTQEDYALCESIVHSRNESSRSSIDFGPTSQRLFQKSIKKSLDFSTGSNDGNTSKSRVRSNRFGDQILKIDPTRLDFCSKTSDVNNRARHRLSGPLPPKVELTRLECVEPVSANEHKERKKARLFTSKENHSKSGPIGSFFAEPYLQKGSQGQDSGAQARLPKPKLSVPSAPTSTPLRLPFAEILNSPAFH